MPAGVSVNSAGAAAIVLFKIHVVSTDIGMIIWGGALVIPAGAAMIVPEEGTPSVIIMANGLVHIATVMMVIREMIALMIA